MSKRKSPLTKGKTTFVRPTISLPDEVYEIGERRASAVEFSGNFSAYVKHLILRDAAEQQKAQAA